MSTTAKTTTPATTSAPAPAPTAATSTTSAAPPLDPLAEQDVAAISSYLNTQAGIGLKLSKDYAVQFWNNGVDSVGVLKTLPNADLKSTMTKCGISNPHQMLITKSIATTRAQDAAAGKEAATNEQNEKEAKIKEAKAEAEKLRAEVESDRKAADAAALTNLNSTLARATQGSSDEWKVKAPQSKDELLKDLDKLINDLNQVDESATKGDYGSDMELLRSVSGGALCKGIHLVNDSSFGLKAGRSLIEYHTNANLCVFSRLKETNETYTDSRSFDFYNKRVQTGGTSHAGSVSVAGFYAGFVGAASLKVSSSSRYDNESTFEGQTTSRTAYSVNNLEVQLSSFQMSPDKLKLDSTAVDEASALKTLGQAKHFLNAFGTHVLLTTHVSKIDILMFCCCLKVYCFRSLDHWWYL